MNDCLACKLNENPDIAPGGTIKKYKHWILDHCVEPIPLRGWLVLRTKRHADGIVGLSPEEALELATVLHVIPKILKKFTGAEIVYVTCLTEQVSHLHFHFIPRMTENEKGPLLLSRLSTVQAFPEAAINPKECLDLIERLKRSLNKQI